MNGWMLRFLHLKSSESENFDTKKNLRVMLQPLIHRCSLNFKVVHPTVPWAYDFVEM